MIKLFTHTDLDGHGCKIVADMFFGADDIDVSWCSYHNIDNAVLHALSKKNYYSAIYITDISVTEQVAIKLQKLADKGVEVKLFDHHGTALNLNKYSFATVCVTDEIDGLATCGTKLFYDYLFQNETKPFVKHLGDFVEIVRRYDTYLWKDYYQDEIPYLWNELFYLLPKPDFFQTVEEKVFAGDLTLSEMEHVLLRIEQARIDTYVTRKCKSIQMIDLYGYRCAVIFAEQNQNQIADYCQQNRLGDIQMIVSPNNISFRTNKEIDVSKIAQTFGGGGHPKASGAVIDLRVREQWLNLLLPSNEIAKKCA